MYCMKCGQPNENSRFCIKCGQPMQADATAPEMPDRAPIKRKRGLAVIILILAVALAVLLLLLILPANPIAGRWYKQDGTELLMLRNGKGMTVMDESSEARRIHFMYAIEYEEPGYIEGEIYEQESGASTWFYLYDDTLEVNGEYYYRQKSAESQK